ncbi:MAG: aminotransferase class I/II-fold pyridoxal phosphate-dependent enzyme [Bacteroidales bacterium]|nr:aminotransferase class I/II-fold pyridoxal phosphate-dependent enzyme [Bacteroidales bacterium]
MKESEILFLLGENSYPSISFPIFQTSNFKFSSVKEFKLAIDDEENSLIYSRGNNPTLTVLAEKLAALDGKQKALLFSSGMAAISTAVISLVKEGDKVLCMEGVYSWTQHLLKNILSRFGVETHFVPYYNIVESINEHYSLIYVESPLTRTFEVVDLEEISRRAHDVGAVVIIDNTYSTPLRQRPADFGIDVVVYSASKYTGGHSDLVGGYLTCDEKLYSRIFNHEYLTFGGIMSPLDAWLFLRGLRTLPVRLDRIEQSTWKIINFLQHHPAIEKIYYPGSISDEQNKIYHKQMRGITGLFSIQFKRKDPGLINAFCEKLRFFRMAVSWGGYESLVLPYTMWKETEWDGMVRLSIGLENSDELIQDLEQGLKIFTLE